ncbi:MAG: hypothetical protein D9V47_11945 [Clostridia bacterium]|nr:MAG: hypothetical protein D9V47_11945 [Clostridia bacterium]
MPQKVLACAWCQGAPRDAELIEESVAFDRLGMVLTLLYIPVDETKMQSKHHFGLRGSITFFSQEC